MVRGPNVKKREPYVRWQWGPHQQTSPNLRLSFLRHGIRQTSLSWTALTRPAGCGDLVLSGVRVGHLQILSAWDHRCSAKRYPLPLTVPLSIFSIGCATFDACGLCTKSGWNPSGFQSISMFALVAACGFMSVQVFFNNRGLSRSRANEWGRTFCYTRFQYIGALGMTLPLEKTWLASISRQKKQQCAITRWISQLNQGASTTCALDSHVAK